MSKHVIKDIDCLRTRDHWLRSTFSYHVMAYLRGTTLYILGYMSGSAVKTTATRLYETQLQLTSEECVEFQNVGPISQKWITWWFIFFSDSMQRGKKKIVSVEEEIVSYYRFPIGIFFEIISRRGLGIKCWTNRQSKESGGEEKVIRTKKNPCRERD